MECWQGSRSIRRSARIETSTESITLRQRVSTESCPRLCLACGWCVDVCPHRIDPPIRSWNWPRACRIEPDPAQAFTAGWKNQAAKKLRRRSARESLHCIGCGLCSYVCPTPAAWRMRRYACGFAGTGGEARSTHVHSSHTRLRRAVDECAPTGSAYHARCPPCPPPPNRNRPGHQLRGNIPASARRSLPPLAGLAA